MKVITCCGIAAASALLAVGGGAFAHGGATRSFESLPRENSSLGHVRWNGQFSHASWRSQGLPNADGEKPGRGHGYGHFKDRGRGHEIGRGHGHDGDENESPG